MVYEIFAAIRGAPVWVWPLFAFLVYLGVRGLKPGRASLLRLAILPLVFLILSIHSLITRFGVSTATLVVWLPCLGVGAALGLWLTARLNAVADRARGVVRTPGSVIPLAVTLVIFVMEYTMGYTAARWPEMVADPRYVTISLALSGLLVGVLLGRFAGFVRVYRAG